MLDEDRQTAATEVLAKHLPVILDAMGGDVAPAATVEGAVRANREFGIPVTLVGRIAQLRPLLLRYHSEGRIPIVDAPEVVVMEEHAVAAVRRHTRASITIAMHEVKEGRGSAIVSAGHSGAVVASALFILGRVPGIDRPGIAALFPTMGGKPVLVIDVGAVSDPKPRHLLHFAYLATSYLRHVEGVAQPRIGLLSNGSEPGKGNNITREVHGLLTTAEGIHFVGNVEGNDLTGGELDAVICDGFTGNVALKTAEGVASLVNHVLKQELTKTWRTKLLGAALRPSLRRAARRLDYREYGGAPLLGVNGNVIIAHGRSDSTAIRNAIRIAHKAAMNNLTSHIRSEIGELTSAKN